MLHFQKSLLFPIVRSTNLLLDTPSLFPSHDTGKVLNDNKNNISDMLATTAAFMVTDDATVSNNTWIYGDVIVSDSSSVSSSSLIGGWTYPKADKLGFGMSASSIYIRGVAQITNAILAGNITVADNAKISGKNNKWKAFLATGISWLVPRLGSIILRDYSEISGVVRIQSSVLLEMHNMSKIKSPYAFLDIVQDMEMYLYDYASIENTTVVAEPTENSRSRFGKDAYSTIYNGTSGLNNP